jgi:hypothetical protein
MYILNIRMNIVTPSVDSTMLNTVTLFQKYRLIRYNAKGKEDNGTMGGVCAGKGNV